MTLSLGILKDIEAPDGTVVISNGEWLTFARRYEDIFYVYTRSRHDFNYDLNDAEKWTSFTQKELQKILKIK